MLRRRVGNATRKAVTRILDLEVQSRTIARGTGLIEIDGTTNVVSSAATGAGPSAVAVNRRTHRAYIANRDGNSVTEIDLATLAVSATIKTAGMRGPNHMFPDGRPRRAQCQSIRTASTANPSPGSPFRAQSPG